MPDVLAESLAFFLRISFCAVKIQYPSAAEVKQPTAVKQAYAAEILEMHLYLNVTF